MVETWHKLTTLQQCVDTIGIPVEQWAGNSYSIARAIVQAGLVEEFNGVAVYGHWGGGVHPDSFFAYREGHPFIQHGWINLEDGRVLDPTRWSFDAKEPYLFIDHNSGEYDEGGNEWRDAMMEPPPWNKEDSQYTISERILKSDAWIHVERLLDCSDYHCNDDVPIEQLCRAQLFWLANVPYYLLEPHAAEIHEALKRCRMKAFIPMDNYRRAKLVAIVAADKHEKHGQWFHLMESKI